MAWEATAFCSCKEALELKCCCCRAEGADGKTAHVHDHQGGSESLKEHEQHKLEALPCNLPHALHRKTLEVAGAAAVAARKLCEEDEKNKEDITSMANAVALRTKMKKLAFFAAKNPQAMEDYEPVDWYFLYCFVFFFLYFFCVCKKNKFCLVFVYLCLVFLCF